MTSTRHILADSNLVKSVLTSLCQGVRIGISASSLCTMPVALRLVPSLQIWRTSARLLQGISSPMRAPPWYLRSSSIVYSAKVNEKHTFEADT